MNEVLDAILLGILQGVTEFLPVSSSGHLALAGLLFGVKDAGVALNVLLHAGTFLATAVVLRDRLGVALRETFRALLRPRELLSTPGGRDASFILLSALPTALLGLGIGDLVDQWTRSPLALGLGFSVTAAVLVSTRFAPKGSQEHPGAGVALLAGLAQGVALAPGISRSGTTIAFLLFLRVARGRAFELSMLMSLPVIFGAILLEARSITELSGLGTGLLGAVVAFGSGIVALVLLRRVVVRGTFPWFALWVLPLAVATLAMAKAWP